MFFFDPLFFVFAIPGLLLGFWAQWRVKSTFNEYSQVATSTRLTGAGIARRVLDSSGLHNVAVERVEGFLSDHYDPSAKVLRLSPDVHDSYSVAAAGVAAHEAGHALQDQQGYIPLQLRSFMVPAVQIGGWVGPLMFMAGLFISPSIAWLGILLFAATVVFALVTLPVEFDASKRAKRLLSSQGIIFPTEMGGINSVLNAAALTYVAVAIQAVGQLVYYVFLLTGFNSNDGDDQ